MHPRKGFQEFRAAFLAAAAAAALAGCGGGAEGPPIGSVSGKVSFDGKPVAEGVVWFVDDKQGRMFPAPIKDGSYTVSSQYGKGIPVSSYKVKVTAAESSQNYAPNETPKPPADPADIPKKYRETETSALTTDVKAGANTFDVEMKPE